MHLNPIDLARDDALSERGLPPIAYADNPKGVYGTSPVIAVKRGEPGYVPDPNDPIDKAMLEQMNR